MENPKMDASRAMARLTRKSRPSDGGRGAKSARPVHSAKGVSGRAPRIVKARAGRPPIPANDTLPLPAEDIGLPGLPEMAAEASVTPEVELAETEDTGEVEATEAALASSESAESGQESDDEEEEEAEQEEVSTERRRGDDEPASFLAMYFRDMAELDVLRPEQEFETARNIEQMELDLWRTVVGFAPGTSWILDVVERELGKPLVEAKLHRAAVSRRRPPIWPSSSAFSTSTASSSTQRSPRFSGSAVPPRVFRSRARFHFRPRRRHLPITFASLEPRRSASRRRRTSS
jgi:hypothetical protein